MEYVPGYSPALSSARCSCYATEKVKDLKAQVKSASLKLAQTERQLSQLSRKHGRTPAQGAPPPTKFEQPPPDTLTPGDQPNEDSASGREGGRVDPQAWYQLEMLRAQHGVLVEDLGRSDDGGGDVGLRDRTLLTAACWQLGDNDGSPGTAGEARRDGNAVLELAAVAVAADLTTGSSGLAQKIDVALEWEVRRLSRSCEDAASHNPTHVRRVALWYPQQAKATSECDVGVLVEGLLVSILPITRTHFADTLAGTGSAYGGKASRHRKSSSVDVRPPSCRGTRTVRPR